MHPCLPVGAPAPTPQSLGPQPPAIDPGAGQRLYAESLLEGARAEVRATGGRAAAMIEEAARSAPRRPNLLHQAGHQFTEFGGGLGQAVVGMADFVVTYSPERLALDPDGWADDVELLGHGLKSSARHPDRFAAAVLDLKTWETSPARALGHLAPTVFLAAATAGGSAVATASAEAVTATATGAAVAGGISEVAKGSTIVPALADVGELDRLRHEVSGGSHPAGFTPGDGSAAARATAEHIALGGNVESAWYNTRLRAGDVIATVESGTRDGADNVMAVPVRSAPAMADREQGAPMPGSVSARLTSITVYRISKDIDVAAAHARQIRPPGFIGPMAANSIRIYIPDLRDLIARGVLTPVQIPVGS
ncbi:MAG: hypothetical protein ABI912_00070 [Actinomycetota bacterium]